MTFRVIAVDADAEMISSAMPTKENALGFARDLRHNGLDVLGIANRAGDVVADTAEIVEWCNTGTCPGGRPERRT